MMKRLFGALGKIGVVVALLVGGLGLSAPAASADGACTASGAISQAPPSLLNPNPTVTFTGHATCSTTHWMGLTTHLTLDCGFTSSSCSNVATGGGSAGSAWTTTRNSTDTYQPNVCLGPQGLPGSVHTWYLMTYLYAQNVGGGWHSATGYATLTFRCPGVV